MSKFIAVTKAHLCPVCEGDHKCSFTADGLFLCGRMSGEQPGFNCLGPSQNPIWTMYRESAFEASRVRGTRVPKKPLDPSPGTAFADLARTCARNFHPLQRLSLAEQLKLPVFALDFLPDLGWDTGSYAYTIPEVDGTGTIVGISTRKPDGTKRCIPGSRRGLVVSAGWADLGGPIFVVEGMSDTAALACVGLSVIGRPSSHVGGGMIAAMLQGVETERPIFVMGENDEKPDGRWPGKDGATIIAKQLAAAFPNRTVMGACPPTGVKDARDWVLSRLPNPKPATDYLLLDSHAVFSPESSGRTPTVDRAAHLAVGKEIAHAFAQLAKQYKAQPADLARRWPSPVAITTIAAEVEADPNPTGWLWDGYLPRNGIVILSALPTCGKTTLLTHLLAALSTGGTFLGRSILPGRAVVLSEEDKAVWAERQKRHNLSDEIAVMIRPFVGRPSHDDWVSFLGSLTADLEADSRDLVIIDTLADLWPVRDENHATDVTDCLKPLRQLAQNGRTVLCIHHVRKSGGDHGTASRGSGAIAGFFDVMMELGYPTGDPDNRRRRLLAKGRMDGIPDETLIEMAKDGQSYHVVDQRTVATDSVKRREDNEDDRRTKLRECLLTILPEGDERVALTREEIWDLVPEEIRKNEVRFKTVLEEGCGELWEKRGTGGKQAAFRYWRKGSD